MLRQQCPTRGIVARLGEKWAFLLIIALASSAEPVRFSALLDAVEGIASKSLSVTLRHLERDGLVQRQVTPTVPITVEYSLTPMGASLADVLGHLQEWTYENIEDITAHRSRYDGLST